MEDTLVTASGLTFGVSSRCMKGKRIRYQQTGEFHFLTFSCYLRRPYLEAVTAKKLFEDALERVRRRYLLVVAGYVVMPEHVHLLVNEPKGALLSKAVQGSQAVGFDAQPRKTILAGALLRFQCILARKVCGEVALHPSQSRQTWLGPEAGRLGVVKLSPLSDGHARNRRDRIGVDSPRERMATARVDALPTARLPSPVPKSEGPGAPST